MTAAPSALLSLDMLSVQASASKAHAHFPREAIVEVNSNLLAMFFRASKTVSIQAFWKGLQYRCKLSGPGLLQRQWGHCPPSPRGGSAEAGTTQPCIWTVAAGAAPLPLGIPPPAAGTAFMEADST